LKHAQLFLAGFLAACSPSEKANSADAVQASAAPSPATPAEAPAAGPQLTFPVACVVGQTCEVQNYVDHDPGPGAKDFRCGTNTYNGHGGIDIRIHDMAAQRAGVPVLAAAPGRVARLRDGVADVSVRTTGAAAVSGAECGNGVVVDHGDGWETQYCHLAKGSLKVTVGEQVAAGQPLANIGLSGNTEYPHAHVTVRHNGAMVDPFAPALNPAACDAGAQSRGMWAPQTVEVMAYKAGTVLNAGFADALVSMEAIEAGGIKAPTTVSPMLIAYVRAINLQGGDVQELTIVGPDGRPVTMGSQPPLDRAKAQYMTFVGKRAAGAAWPAGEYRATYVVRRGSETALNRTFSIRLDE
jgi:hypothetical protein